MVGPPAVSRSGIACSSASTMASTTRCAVSWLQAVDLVGPVCESGDFLAKDRRLPPVRRGDLICIFSAGAYGFTMSSQYNSRPRVAEVLIDGSTTRLIRRRETYDDLVALERDEAISSS